jgi:hypothetical protein
MIGKAEERMRDEELRGVILQRFYDRRHRGSIVQLTDLAPVLPSEPRRVANLCEELAQTGLIEWKTSKSVGAVGGIGKITSAGIGVIEGNRPSPIALQLAKPLIARANVPNTPGSVDKALEAIDNSNASEAEKLAAKALIGQLGTNPLAWSVLEAMFGAGS